MKHIVMIIFASLMLFGRDVVLFEDEYQVLELEKQVKKVVVGNKAIVNVSPLGEQAGVQTQLKLFGKKSGNTSLLMIFDDGTYEEVHLYVNQNLGYIQKMINTLEPKLSLSRVGSGSTVLMGTFEDPHQKSKIFNLLKSAGIDLNTTMDLTQTKRVNKMVRTKLYLVEVNNNKAKDLGGITGLGFFNEYLNISLNAEATSGATFSGFLLDNTQKFVAQTGNSVVGTLRFLEEKGVAKILDDTVLITTEENNATFHVGGEVYIPIGLTQNAGALPTIQLEQKEYGLRLTLKTKFMEKKEFMHIDVQIKDSEFDTNHEHDVQLGEFTVVPSFISKNIDTDVVVRSGQVIALGGRLHTEAIEFETKVPLLGDIPWLGELFKSKQSGTKENDLLFFLVPQIVDANEEVDDGAFYKEFKEESRALHKKVADFNQSVQADTANSNQSIAITFEEASELLNEPNEPQKSALKSKANYSVRTAQIYLRSQPSGGEKMLVWEDGHLFVGGAEREVDGRVWMEVVADCSASDACAVLKQPLWISKKYTQQL